MKMALFVNDFPMALLENMERDLAKYAKCLIQNHGTTVMIQCENDLVKCMEVIAIVDKYNFRMEGTDTELFSAIESP